MGGSLRIEQQLSCSPSGSVTDLVGRVKELIMLFWCCPLSHIGILLQLMLLLVRHCLWMIIFPVSSVILQLSWSSHFGF